VPRADNDAVSVTPLVSVLIPTYNGERFIAETISSVLAQTHQHLEVIVGDDCSTDGTVDVVRRVAGGDPRVRVLVYDRNIGGFASHDLLHRAATGQYTKFLLQDDLLADQAIERLVEPLEHDPRLVLATSKRALIDEGGNRLPDGPHTAAISARPGVVDGRALGDLVLANMLNVIGEVSTVLFRRSVDVGEPLLSIDTREMVANGDIALWLKLLAQGDAFYTPSELSSFRQHDRQSSRLEDTAVGGLSEWPVIVDRARALGFLADPALERAVHVRIARAAADLLGRAVGTDREARVLEVLYLTTARLAELGTGPAEAGNLTRLHGPGALERLRHPLDCDLPELRHRPPVAEAAIAAPAVASGEVAAAVEGLRTLALAGAARRFIALVPPQHLVDAEPLFVEALAAGPDFELELVPGTDVAAVRRPGWILVPAA
jgi:glycosyltransferase involved in cell wall biosynthesis